MNLLLFLTSLLSLDFYNNDRDLACESLMLDVLKSISFFQDVLLNSKAILNKDIFHISTSDHNFIKSFYTSET